jgi:glycerol-3-phosphate dehydrogenase
MNREAMLGSILRRTTPWDMIVIGGGATGVGVAIDAASRGFEVLLLEAHDFGKGTSSRSTKLIHGGVRYLEQGNISLVMEALKERGLLRQNAPHLVHDLAFIVPNYSWWEAPFYGIGMKIYDLLAGQYGFGRSRILSAQETIERLPNLQTEGLRGGVIYYDGQFDDTRLLIHMAATAADHGATLLNYAPVVEILKDEEGFADGVTFLDEESGQRLTQKSRVVINATGPFADNVRQLSDPEAKKMTAPSQGIHLVFERSFLRADAAIMVPHTSDGRVLFAIPWHQHTLVGTTDTPIQEPSYEPLPFEEEIEFILDTAAQFLSRPPTREDILSVYVGIRPLVKSQEEGVAKTSTLSRDHTIHIDSAGLITILGGKWTTYRHMAEDCVNHAITLGRLVDTPCITRTLKLHGYHESAEEFGNLEVYGSDAAAINELASTDPDLLLPMHPDLTYCIAEIIWAVRFEMARTIEDVLARRTRALFLNARAAISLAPKVGAIMAEELNQNQAWIDKQIAAFNIVAENYVVRQ